VAEAPDDLHEWISFEDPEEQRTWVFDATFLRSNYRCIYGEGCQGVLDAPAPELALGCCSYGAHFVDEEDVANVVKAFVRVRPDQMQFHAKARRGGFMRPGEPGDDGAPTTVTRLIDDACIFLNRPGFAGGVGCALHIAALEAGERPLDWKPNVCWQVPLRLEHSTDENGHVTSRLREWKRRDWGDGGSEFAWWCTEAPEAFSVPGEPTVLTGMKAELQALVGTRVHRRLLDAVAERLAAGGTPIPHPTVRRR
jgi:hypothetical protein